VRNSPLADAVVGDLVAVAVWGAFDHAVREEPPQVIGCRPGADVLRVLAP
jgi:hypothetical protein